LSNILLAVHFIWLVIGCFLPILKSMRAEEEGSIGLIRELPPEIPF
jgi:hypothetical protein